MLGKHHVLFGCATFVAAASTAVAAGELAVTPLQLIVGSAVAMGAALVPDLDEPGSSASRSFGRIGRLGARVVAKVTGGHRGGTHTVPFVAAVVAVVYLLTASPVAVALLLGLMVVVGLDVLKRVPEGAEWLAGAMVALVSSRLVGPGELWPALAVGCGWVSHMVGDTLTPHGVPWLWPLRPLEGTVSVGLFRSGSRVEPLVVWLLVGGLLWVAWVQGGGVEGLVG